MTVPSQRVRKLNHATIRPEGSFVIYWMTAFRRVSYNFALERALEHCRDLGRPLLILESLRCDYPWASDRFHRFVLEGMRENRRRTANKDWLRYYPYIERCRGEGKGLLEALSAKACCVVGDDYPCFFLPKMAAAAAMKLDVSMEVVDSNGLLPMRSTDRIFKRAVDFRRFLQKELEPHLAETPKKDALGVEGLPGFGSLPVDIAKAWVPADDFLAGKLGLETLPIDHEVTAVDCKGGSREASKCLRAFISRSLDEYVMKRNHPDEWGTTNLSPYLHFGHISTHQLFEELAKSEGWSIERLSSKSSGSRAGWWNMSASAEALLDQIVTWRELGFNRCWQQLDYSSYETLPEWARQSLEEHEQDPRPYTYTLQEFERALTHDPIWNAAQRELVREGRMHNYLRMLWGKKILHWSPSPRQALQVMIELNNKYALDGRDPNSYSGIFWCLGRYDRAWGPERPIFGKVRYMTSASTKRKLRLKDYLLRYGPELPVLVD